jgi:Zn-dependent M28 family amino/carboxypeptidase
MLRMPGQSFRGELPAATEAERSIQQELERHVRALAVEIGPRSGVARAALDRARDYVEAELRDVGYQPTMQRYSAGDVEYANIEAVRGGATRPDEIVVVGAHYDTVPETPGADDNASGAAALLALADRFADRRSARTLRFVAFANEEPPHFQSETMGSLVYARACRARGDRVTAMLSLESVGYYAIEPGTQKYPPPLSAFFPSTGDFIGFVGNLGSRALVQQVVGAFREHARFPSEGAALPGWIPGVGWSDQWAFWAADYPALMVTDTAPFRNPNYHTPNDILETLDLERTARVVLGLEHVIALLVDAK